MPTTNPTARHSLGLEMFVVLNNHRGRRDTWHGYVALPKTHAQSTGGDGGASVASVAVSASVSCFCFCFCFCCCFCCRYCASHLRLSRARD